MNGRPVTNMAEIKARLALAESFRRVFAGPDGETVLHDLLRQAGVLDANTEGEPTGMAYVEGRRSLGLYVLDQLRFTASDLLRLSSRRVAIETEET